MQCMTCQAEILPSYVAAIRNNICPGCGDKIFNQEAQELFTEIGEAFKKMEGNPEGLAGWLLSNYHIKKKGTDPALPVEFYGKKEATKKIVPQRAPGQVQTPAQSPFMRRAGANVLTRKELEEKNKYQALVNQIQGDGEEPAEVEVDGEFTQEDLANDPYLAAEIAKAQSGGTKFTSNASVNPFAGAGPPLSQEEMAFLSNDVENMGLGVDTGIGVKCKVNQDRIQRLNDQQSMLNGMKSSGMFTRKD